MRILVLTGAGVSAESGLGTFRDTGGLWARHDLADLATPEGFSRNPALVHDFYNARRADARAAKPNAAHLALAALTERGGDAVTLVTQNIDDLHERAGARDVIHMHGAIDRARCAACGHRWDAPAAMHPADPCPACGAAATRPDVVWFGEMPHHMDRIEAALAACDLFVAIGTSGSVWPAAGFVDLARSAGARTLEINLVPSDRAGAFDDRLLGPATQAVPAWVASLEHR
ncbi:MAG: NAD-dependent deacylase [Gemmobacter sp.]